MVDFVGQQLGNYRLLRLLGQGAFAAVYLGEHQYLERPAAVKVLHIQMAPDSHEAFRREARTIARLDHPHIIRVLDFGIEGQIPYLVMEYMPNGTLRTQHPKGTLLPFEKILDYVKQIASALDYAHEQKVIHRDIKPENILLNTRHEVVLSDFGIAVVQPTLDSLSLQSAVGTPLYMAPEQIRGQPCAASDQYALGVMVYEWLCGEPPFRGPSMAVFFQHLHDQPPSLYGRFPHLSPAIEDVVMGALAKDPQRRFSCVQDFALMLEEAFFATQPLSLNEPAEDRPLDQSARPATRATSSMPVPSTSEEEYSDEPTQPRIKTIQRIEEEHGRVARVSPPPTARSQVFSIMCVCAPADKAYLARWETHLRPLEQAGYLTVWSEQQILAGTPRTQLINAHLEQADLIVLLLSADFFDSDECIALMERALRRYQRGAAHVIPLLLRPVEWQESPLAPLSCIPSNQLPVTEWTNQDAAFGECVREIRQILDPTASTRIVEPPPPSALQNRLRLLRRVRSFWITGLLEQSLHGAALMALELKELPDAVANPWHLMLYSPDRTPRPLPAGMRITQVYDNADGELLILGAPGSGKTTLLLELARDLLLQAEHNARLPLPVVFNLSSWSLKQQRLTAWLVDELNSKYQVPRKLGQALVDADQILPLLDGLDEVAPKSRTACIEAINLYRQEHGFLPLVVCSRIADYLEQNTRILLRNAVALQPLTASQVDAYLKSGGESLRALRVALQQDAALRELTKSPLMLSILTLTYHGKPVEELLQRVPPAERQRQVFEHYVARMLARRRSKTYWTSQQILSQLSWLAWQLKRHNQTVFYIERLQPDWLTGRWSYWFYQATVIWPVNIFIGLLVGLLVSAPNLIPLHIAVLVGVLVSVPASIKISTIGSGGVASKWLWSKLIKIIPLIGGGILTAAIAIIITHKINIVWMAAGSVIGLVVDALISIRSTDIQPFEVLVWSWRKFTKFAHLRNGILTGLIVLIMLILSQWQSLIKGSFPHHEIRLNIIHGIVYSISSLFVVWLLSGLVDALSGDILSDQHRVRPNQGTHRSARNSMAVGVIVGIVASLLVGSMIGLIYWLRTGLDVAWTFAWVIGIIFGLGIGIIGGLLRGGDIYIKHFMLRLQLWLTNRTPWNYARFLDHAAERTLLRKVGGGYIFVHRLLLEYFATLANKR